jgi:hypothetical protein
MSTFGPFRNPALGGGEEVRVCNPCVPDPNYGPPPQYVPSIPSRYTSQSSSSSASRPHFPPGSQPTHPRAHRSSSNVHDPSSYVPPPRPSDNSMSTSTDSRRVSYHGSSSTHADRWLPPLPSTRPPDLASTSRYTTPHNGQLPFNLGPGSQSVVNMFPRPTPTPAVRPRRQIAEEDECPICGNELPPASDDTGRTLHIEECIALHSASPAPAQQTLSSASLPAQRTRGMSSVGGGGETSRMAHAARGMFTFTATEKDCVDAEGGEEECVICFEEYGAGDRMARLVCWCKFHEVCEVLSFLFCLFLRWASGCWWVGESVERVGKGLTCGEMC